MTDYKGALVPPLIALTLYLLVLYVLRPLYRQRQTYAPYLPVSFPSENIPGTGVFSRTRGRVREAASDFFGPRMLWRRPSIPAEFNFGDEELEEGFPGVEHLPSTDAGRNAQDGMGTERRLSRELEAGFMDDSDEEENDRAQ